MQVRLSQDIDVNGTSIENGSYVFGTASLSDERLQIKITSIQWKNNVYPVSLEVYDMDGLRGVYIPGSIGRETAKQSADRAISGMGLTSLDPSLGAQTASAGIEAVKSLIGKKIKLVRVTIPAGYHILLKDSHSN
ncbi:MAG: conjugative transposon protein TraM [Bacteroidota bacterium]|nr:conjugative transposon protein TraM [Bacteroidota bacterium]